MRIAIVADIHGNGTAFEAVVSDLRKMSPDLVLHGGDLTDSGSSPVRIVHRIRELGWQGVMGNTDEMLFRPQSLKDFAAKSPDLKSMFAAIEDLAEATRQALGEERLAWLQSLPQTYIHDCLALVHATPESLWRAPAANASNADLQSAYESLGKPIAIYAHIHHAYVRTVGSLTVANAGSAGLAYNGDPRATYLLVDERHVSIRRVEYDIDVELRALAQSGLPHTDWTARIIRYASPQMP